MTWVAVGLGVGALAGGVAGGAISAHGATSAANTQAQAANHAADVQHQDAMAALDFQKQQYNTGQAQIAPWLQTGQTGLANLSYLLGMSPNKVPAYSGAPQASAASALPDIGSMNFGQAIATGNPNISPNQETTDGWSSQGVPFHNVQTADGRMVAVRDSGPPTLNAAPNANGVYSIQNNPAFDTMGAGFAPVSSGIGGTANPNADGTAAGAPGSAAPNTLGDLVNPNLGGFGSLLTPFQAPTGLDETNDPGYKARLQLGTDAVQRSAAARGGLLSGSTLRDLNTFAQDYGSNEYGNVYNRAFNTFETNQNNTFNRLASLSGIGQTAVNTSVNAGQNAAGQIGNTLLTSGAQQAQQINNAAAARASGIVGSANAWGGTLGGIGGNLTNLLLLRQLQGGGSSPYGNPGAPTYLAGG